MLEVTVNISALERFGKDIEKLPALSFRCLQRAFFRVGEEFRTFHRNERLTGRPGLIQRHGQAGLAGAIQTIVEGSTINQLVATTFVGAPATAYARVQELGTVGAGGQLPDIVPTRGRFLSWIDPTTGVRRFARKVAIPPRLGFVDAWDRFAARRNAILDACLDDIIDATARGKGLT